MANLVARRKKTDTVRNQPADHWQSLVEGSVVLQEADEVSREQAWQALSWAQDNITLPEVKAPVSAEKSEAARIISLVLQILSTPPQAIAPKERLERARVWAARLRYPLLDALCGVMAAEAGQVKMALSIFEPLKSVGVAFAEVPLIAGRALLHCGGNDSKVLHKAEWFLKHAEHLSMDGDEESEATEDEEVEPLACDVDLDEAAQRRLSEIWSLMATLYTRLGDGQKSEMYRSRAGIEEVSTSEDAEETPEGKGEFTDAEALRAPDRKLLFAFLQSPQFHGLSAQEQRLARMAVPYFVSLGRTYLAIAPTRLDRYSLEELLVALIPEKMVATLEDMALVPAVLTAWIYYLGKAGQLRDAGRLGVLVGRLAGEFMTNSRNRDCWGMSETVAMQMLQSGVDLSDPREVDRWLADRPVRLLAG